MGYIGTRRSTKPGIEIFIGLRETKYDLFINISPGTDVSKKIEGDDFTLKLTYADGSTEVKELLHFERLKKPCKWKGGKLIDSDYIIKTPEYKLVVMLKPKLYATRKAQEMEAKNEIQRKQKSKNNQGSKGKKGKKKKGGNLSYRGSHCSGFPRRTTTNYTYTNLYSPYQGGRCSSK